MLKVFQMGALALAVQSLPAVSAPVRAPVHHLVAIDISGSMYRDLPELRTHLKNKLATLVDEGDTISIVWFSGRGQFGVLVEAMKVRGVADLSTLHTAIDRFLRPMGLTGFKEPLEEIERLATRFKAAAKNARVNFFFMTDGYDNQWSAGEILTLCRRLERIVDSAAVVEYGWHCNRPLLTQMAEALGGQQIFSQDFQSYQAAFEGALSGLAAPKVAVKLAHPVTSGSVFALSGERLLTFTPDTDNVVLVPEGLTAAAYFTSAAGVAFDHKKHRDPHLWAGLVPLAQRMDSNAVFGVLGALGDVALVNQFSSCFSKEDYSGFQDAALACATDPARRYAEGYDPKAVPAEDAYTVLDLLNTLANDEENLFYPYHESFHYERIGAAAVSRLVETTFEPDRSQGYPVNALVWNEDRPNVNLQVRIEGVARLPAARPAVLPATLPSFIYRNFTIIRDGIVHTRTLPVSLSAATFAQLQAQGLLAGERWTAGKVYALRYPKLPVINRRMVKSVAAKDTFATVLELQRLKGAQKVFNDYRNRLAPKTSAKFQVLYGQEATEYLANLGITDYNGFNPPSDTVKSGDFYLAKELKIAAKGLSSLPKVADVEAALTAGKKLKVSEAVMAPALQRVLDFQASPIYKDAADPAAVFTAWLEGEANAAVQRTREVMQILARSKFAVVVGHTWFADLPSMDAASLDVELAGFGPVTVTASLHDIEVKI